MRPQDLLKSDLLSETIVVVAALAVTMVFLTVALVVLRVSAF
jgi:hypothetical protein